MDRLDLIDFTSKLSDGDGMVSLCVLIILDQWAFRSGDTLFLTLAAGT